MIRGLYTAATGLNVQTKKMDVISNDLANVNTSGYKKDTAVIASFPEVLASRLDDVENQVPNNGPIGRMSLGARVDEVYTHFTQGSVVSTNEVVDMALQGSGFFVIQTPAGLTYTRDGNFSIDRLGNIVTKEGYSVMGQDGPISLGEDFLTTGGEIIIKPDGTIYKGTEYIDQLDLADFADTRTLTKIDNNLYQATAPRIEFNGSVIQGYLEASTVNPVTAMVDMITVSRAYEANQKVVQTHDSLLGRAVNDVGKM